jgi:dolichyl-phosphate beta-glucosyltransferase
MTDSAGSRPTTDAVFLSVIIPAFDEVDRIAATVTRVVGYLDQQPYRSELIVVLDGGRPGALNEAKRAASGRADVTVLDNEVNRGKGFSVRRGVAASRGRYVLFADADLSLPIEGADQFIGALQAGADVAIGSRMVPGSRESGRRQPFRQSLGRMFNWIVRAIAVPGIQDTQCGFKAFDGSAARALFKCQRTDGFVFDVEVLRMARRRSLRIVEVPVLCEYHQSSSVRRLQHGAQMLRDLTVVLWRDWRGQHDDPN